MLFIYKGIHLIAVYICVELQSLSFYMLAACKSNCEANTEAGLKYFILGAFSSALLLLGATMCYAYTGSANLNDLILISTYLSSTYLPYDFILQIGLACILISFLFKLAAVPFHSWIADVYDGSLLSITCFFATCSQLAPLIFII